MNIVFEWYFLSNALADDKNGIFAIFIDYAGK